MLISTRVRTIPNYGLARAQIGGREVIASQTGFTGEKGYDVG